MSNFDKHKQYQDDVATLLINQIEAGTAPWQKPWNAGEAIPSPFNAVTNRPYAGMNALYLHAQGFNDPRFMTFKQANDIGAKVRKNEKGFKVEFVEYGKEVTKVNELGEEERVYQPHNKPIYKHYTVFNATQIDGLEPYQPKKIDFNHIEKADNLIKGFGVEIRHDQRSNAFYRPNDDRIHMPDKSQFKNEAAYYATALHEIGHATGHQSRLNRDFGIRNTQKYAREELRAEIASYMIARDIGIGHDPSRHASYVDSWLGALKNDKTEIFRAVRDASIIKQFVIEPDQRQEIIEKYAHKGKHDNTQAQSQNDNKPNAPLVNHQTASDSLADFIRGHGFRLDDAPIFDGQGHRLKHIKDKGKKTSGSYMAHNNGIPNATLIDYRGEKHKWIYYGKEQYETPNTEQKKQYAENKRKAEAKKNAERIAAIHKARDYWHDPDNENATKDNSPYLKAKNVDGHVGVKVDKKGNTLIPLKNAKGEITAISTITPKGDKYFTKNGQKQGSFFIIDPDKNFGKQDIPVVLAEGYATAASVNEATKFPVVVTFDAGNLGTVATWMRDFKPNNDFIIAADNDHERLNHDKTKLENIGLIKANDVAEKINAKIISPDANLLGKGNSDFNDLHRQKGIKAVQQAFITKGIILPNQQKHNTQQEDMAL